MLLHDHELTPSILHTAWNTAATDTCLCTEILIHTWTKLISGERLVFYEKSQFICAFFSFRFTSHMKLSSRHLFLKANHPPTIIPNKRTMLLSLRNSWTQTKLLHYETRYLWDSFKDFIFSVGASGPPDRAKGGQGIKRCTSGLFVLPFLLTITKHTHTTTSSAALLKFCDHHLTFLILVVYVYISAPLRWLKYMKWWFCNNSL